MNEHEARDEREALQRLIYTFETTDLGDNLAITTRDSYALVDAILAAGYRKHPEPEITDEAVERVARAVRADYVGRYREDPPFHHAGPGQPVWRHIARAALKAAGYRKHPEPEWEYAHSANGYWNDEETEFTAEDYYDVTDDPEGAIARRAKAGPWGPIT